MEPTRARASRSRGCARRTQHQIRHQTLPVGNVYASNELRLPADAQDLQTLLPHKYSSQDHCNIQDSSEGNKPQDPGTGSFRSGDIGHSNAFAAAERYLDLGESIDSDHVENRALGTGKASTICRNMEGFHHNTQYTSA
jgi:hypothetical protein